ncbi:hypothetical protein J6590_087826, partial [Homalodisca vitripennis]
CQNELQIVVATSSFVGSFDTGNLLRALSMRYLVHQHPLFTASWPDHRDFQHGKTNS